MESSKLTSKYQTTIPRRIRDFLKLDIDSSVEYHIENGRCYIKKGYIEECPACNGKGAIDGDYKCFICLETGEITSENQIIHSIVRVGRKYNFSYQIYSDPVSTENDVLPFSKCVLLSEEYPEAILHMFQDIVQFELIVKNLAYTDINEYVVEKAVSLMKTEEGKARVAAYFDTSSKEV